MEASIEMELAKIHGGSDDAAPQEEKIQEVPAQASFSTDVIGLGAIEQSSDSELPAEEESFIRNIGEVRAKLEAAPNNDASSSDKPNILKKRTTVQQATESVTIKQEAILPGQQLIARQDSVFTCLLCQGDETVAGDVRAITGHMKTVHELRLYICDVCGQDFQKRNEFNHHMDEHVNTHSGIRPYVCQQCGKGFATKYTLRAHEKTHEVRPRPYSCGHCSKSFLSQQNLVQHERTHSGVKEFSCNLCSKRFGSARSLEVHSVVHPGYKPFVCEICNKAFARKAEVRDHARTHTGERDYLCETCGATFSRRTNLQSHQRETHLNDKRYKCLDCGKGFKRQQSLDCHMRTAHTGERPFTCDVCGATFVDSGPLKRHRRIHTGEKPFKCEMCGKAFNDRDNRNAHYFVHSDKKPYECLTCGAGFMRKPQLHDHMKLKNHLNDTIVVNKPHLITDNEQPVTVSSGGEIEAVDSTGFAEAVDAASLGEDSKVHISEHIPGSSGQDQSDNDGMEAVEYIIIDEEQIGYENVDDDETTGGSTRETLFESETHTVDTPDEPLQFIRARIPNEKGEEEETLLEMV